MNNLGIIDKTVKGRPSNVYRSHHLEKLDQFYENRQYDHLADWDQACQESEDFIAIRKRKPRIIFPFASNFSGRLTSKLIGESVFPRFPVEGSPDDQEFIAAVILESNLRSHLLEPFRRTVATGSCFIRFWISGGRYHFKWYKTKFCYPVWQDGDLESVKIRYVYADENQVDLNGDPKLKWYQLELNKTAEITFDNPDYEEDVEPTFNEVSRIEHGLGFVQGQWFRTDETSEDGYGFISDITTFIDEFNYNLSQSSQALSYNQEPQLAFSKMTEDETANIIRSSTRSWNLGREGDAKFIESDLGGVESAGNFRDKIKTNLSDITRIVVLDPEKIVGSAQSAKAMEVLHGPLKDLVDELRLVVGPQIRELVLRLAIATLKSASNGVEPPLDVEGYTPGEGLLRLKTKWPELFQQTLDDLQKKVAIASGAKNGGLIAPRTATKYVAEDFGVEDIDAEIAEIEAHQAAQAAMNPFSGGF